MTMLLTKETIQDVLVAMPGWKFVEGKRIEKEFSFDSFLDATAFVNRVAGMSEGVQHHPDIDIRYTMVRVALSTHDAGGVTEKDIDSANSIETLVC